MPIEIISMKKHSNLKKDNLVNNVKNYSILDDTKMTAKRNISSFDKNNRSLWVKP